MDFTPSSAHTASPSPERLILFVSADPQEVANVQAGLEDMRPRWSLEVTQHADGALSACQSKSFDAAVVDLLLPDSAGVGLLKEIMERYPDTLRIGLTTAPERQAIQAIGAPAHQLLSKPCDAKALKAVLARAFASRDFLAHDQVKQLVAGISSLPVLPAIYTELMLELKSDEPSLERAGQIVARDMGLSTKILSLVNSAFFGLGRSIAHPSEAAMFLGSETLKALVLSLNVFSQFHHLKLTEFSVDNLWKHSWATGVLARRLCEFEEADRATTDEAFISGLLHDVGKLMLAVNYPEKLQENIRLARRKNITFWEQEYSSYNASHAELGGYLLNNVGRACRSGRGGGVSSSPGPGAAPEFFRADRGACCQHAWEKGTQRMPHDSAGGGRRISAQPWPARARGWLEAVARRFSGEAKLARPISQRADSSARSSSNTRVAAS